MGEPTGNSSLRFPRLLVAGIVVVVAVLGLVLLVMAVGQSRTTAAQVEAVDALATSSDACVVCHRQSTPGIVEQYGQSTMAAAEVGCRDCHQVSSDYPGAVENEGTFVLNQPTPARCERCHSAEVAQFYQSRHSLPAYTAMTGTGGLRPEHLAMVEAIPEGSFAPDKMRTALFAIEGPAITRFACEACHNIGRPQPDRSE